MMIVKIKMAHCAFFEIVDLVIGGCLHPNGNILNQMRNMAYQILAICSRGMPANKVSHRLQLR